MRGIAMLLVALWGILRRMVILGFRNFIAVEEEGTRRGTTMCDATERHCSGVEQAADPEDSVSGVEEPAGEEEETHQATTSAAIVSRVEEEGSRQGTTSDDIIASHISGDKEVARTRVKWFHSRVNVKGRRCTFQCVKIENGSATFRDYKFPVRSLKELEEAVEECNSMHLLSRLGMIVEMHLSSRLGMFAEILDMRFHMNVPELEVTEELIKLLMRINKDRVHFTNGGGARFLEEVFGYACYMDVPNLMKLVVGVGMVKSSVVCPMSPFVDKAAMDSAFMSCHTMPQLLKLLLDFNPNFGLYLYLKDNVFLCAPSIAIHKPWVMMQEYNANVFGAIKGFKEADLLSILGLPKDEFQCYSETTNRGCTLQNLTNQWKLDAHVTGLKSPWSKNFNQTSQTIELEVLMEPSVLLNNSLTLKILNLKFHSDNAGSDASAEILSRFFLSGVALTATPEVDLQDFMCTKLGLGSANPAYDMLSGTTLGTSATVPLGKGVPTVGFTSTQTISLTSKSVTDWKREQTQGTQNCHSSKSGTFSWTLKNLGGIPFDRENPSYPRSFKKSRLELPFNEDGSVTFTDKEYPDPITWNFKPELEGTMVVWRISMEVYVTILNISRSKSRSTSAGKTLKFCFARHLEHKLSTDSIGTSLVLQ